MSEHTITVGEQASVFISYSRSDRDHAERIADALRRRGHEVSRDLDDILPTEEWSIRIRELITDADVIVFLLSPRSAASEVCRWEVDLAQTLNKKIAPIVVEDVEGAKIPQMLSRLNYIFATERDRFENAISSLCDAIGTDVDWLREHTRLTRLALQFEKSGKRKSDLLSEANLTDAEHWLVKKPVSVASLSPAVAGYIHASRTHHTARMHYAEARLKALNELVEPMLAKETETLRDRARELDANWAGSLVRTDSKGAELRDRIKTIENFNADRGRWHPLAAEHVKTAGADADYLEVYRFPCCSSYATLAEQGTPLQFRDDGCQEDPS
jgi:hypothetical protein